MAYFTKDPFRELIMLEHFLTNQGEYTWNVSTSGEESSMSGGNADSNHPGIMNMNTGTTSTGYCLIGAQQTTILFGGAKYMCRSVVSPLILSDASEEYIFATGFGDTNSNDDHVDGAYFEYDRAANEDYWVAATASNSSRTKTVTSVAVEAGKWYDLAVFVRRDVSAVEFMINGNLVARHTTNIPSGSGRQTSFRTILRKTAGTTSRNSMAVDLLMMQANFI